MRAFFTFEVLVALLCSATVYLLTATSFFSLAGADNYRSTYTHDAALTNQDTHLALFWMRRTLTQSYRHWYLHDADTYDTVPPSHRLPHTAVAEGHILFPLHVVYLRLCGWWLRQTQPRVALLLLSDDAALLSRPAEMTALRGSFAVVAAACVVLIGGPASWRLAAALTRLLTRAVQEREKASRLQLPPAVYASYRAAASASPPSSTGNDSASTQGTSISNSMKREQTGAGVLPRTEVATPHNVHIAATFAGALLLVTIGLVPLLVMEVSTLQPWCLAGSLLVWAVYAVLQDEEQRHFMTLNAPSAGAADDDAAFDLTTPIVEEGAVVFFALKQPPSLRPLVTYTVLATVLSLTLPSCLYVAPLFCVWGLTSCWQHGYRRVLVKVKADSATAAAAGAAAGQMKDGLLRVGHSCYTDKLYMNTCFSYASLCCVLTVLAVTTPWWWQQQPLLTFMDLFASPPLPTHNTTTSEQGASNDSKAAALAAQNSFGIRSFTGAHELEARCLAGLRPFYSCAVPTANAWRLSEWFGVRWTHYAKSLTRLFISQDDYVDRESARWLDFATVILAVAANAASLLVLMFYRIRKPPLSFEAPVRYAAERAAHQAEQQAYWEAKQLARHRGTASSSSQQNTNTPAKAAGDSKKRAKVITCLCREEYLVKQVVLLSWMLALAAASGTLLFMRNAPTSGVLTLTCAALLAAVYGTASVLRRTHPLAFYPLSPDGGAKAAAGAATQPPTPQPTAATAAAEEGESTKKEEERKVAAPGVRSAAKATPSQPAAPGQTAQQEEKVDPSALTQQDGDDPRPPAASRWCTSAVAPSLVYAGDVAWLLLTLLAVALSTGTLTWTVVPPLLRQCVLVGLGGAAALALWRLRSWAAVDLVSSLLYTGGRVSEVLLLLVLTLQCVPQRTVLSAHGASYYMALLANAFGDVYAPTGEAALRALILQCAVACLLYVSCVSYATLRIARMALEPEEVSLVPIESELSFFSKPAATKKQQ